MQREICSDSDGDPVVWEEFSNPTNGMRGDAGENVFEPGEGLDSHPLTGSHETPQYRGSLAAFIAAKEDPIVATNRHTADHAFRGVVVDPDISILAVACQGRPVFQGIAHRPPFWTLRQHCRLDFHQVLM